MNWGRLFKGNNDKSKSENKKPESGLKGSTKYIGKDGTVILDKNGKILTVWENSEKHGKLSEENQEKLRSITEQERTKLKECLTRYSPALLDKMPFIETGELEDSVINEMREAVGNELMNSGFNSNGSPNEYGLQLEEIIDTLTHYWKSRRTRLY